MKNFLCLLVFSILFSSCYNYYSSAYQNYENGPQVSLFTSIPIKPSVEKVKIYFPGEKLPEDPYLKVDVLDVFGNAVTSTQSMITRLKNQAELRGMDAILIISKDNISEILMDENCENYTVTTQKLSGLGIKFVKNITYLDECLKGGRILKWDTDSEQFVEKTKFKTDWKGNLLEIESGDQFYYNFLYHFSKQHLIHEVNSDWMFLVNSSSPGTRVMTRVKRDRLNREFYEKQVRLKEVHRKTVSAQIKSPYNQIYAGKVDFYYNQDNQLTRQDIDSKTLGEFQQKFTYAEDGSLEGVEVFDLKEDTPQLYFKVVFDKYQQEDLAQLLEEEQS